MTDIVCITNLYIFYTVLKRGSSKLQVRLTAQVLMPAKLLPTWGLENAADDDLLQMTADSEWPGKPELNSIMHKYCNNFTTTTNNYWYQCVLYYCHVYHRHVPKISSFSASVMSNASLKSMWHLGVLSGIQSMFRVLWTSARNGKCQH